MPFGASNCNNTVQNATLTAATEIVAGVTTAESLGVEPNTQGLRIRATAYVTGAAGTTSYTPIVRRGAGTGGAIVQTLPAITVAASAVAAIPIDVLDSAPAAGNNIYTVTLNAAGANATLNAITIGLEICDQYQGN